MHAPLVHKVDRQALGAELLGLEQEDHRLRIALGVDRHRALPHARHFAKAGRDQPHLDEFRRRQLVGAGGLKPHGHRGRHHRFFDGFERQLHGQPLHLAAFYTVGETDVRKERHVLGGGWGWHALPSRQTQEQPVAPTCTPRLPAAAMQVRFDFTYVLVRHENGPCHANRRRHLFQRLQALQVGILHLLDLLRGAHGGIALGADRLDLCAFVAAVFRRGGAPRLPIPLSHAAGRLFGCVSHAARWQTGADPRPAAGQPVPSIRSGDPSVLRSSANPDALRRRHGLGKVRPAPALPHRPRPAEHGWRRQSRSWLVRRPSGQPAAAALPACRPAAAAACPAPAGYSAAAACTTPDTIPLLPLPAADQGSAAPCYLPFY